MNLNPLTGLPVEFVRLLAVKPLDDFFDTLMRAQSFRDRHGKFAATNPDNNNRPEESRFIMTSETQDTHALTVVKDQLPTNADGWDAAASDSANKPIKGQSIKFDAGAYFLGKEKILLKPDRRFVAMDLRQGWMFLKKDTPAEYVMRPIDGPKPPRPDSFTEESEWPDGLDGKPADPWKYTRFLYLLDPQTAETFTFTSSTWGGLRGLDDLTQQIKLMRTTEPSAVPIVELQSAPWSTKYGIKQRPLFKVVGWHIKATAAPKLLADDNEGSGDGGLPGTEVVTDMNDEIPF